MIRCIGVIVGISLIYSLHAEYFLIQGRDSSYAGSEIAFYYYSNPLLLKEEKLASSTVHDNGEFSLRINVNKALLTFCYLGVHKCYLYAEPGFSYTILLPPKRDKTPQDLLNPYFIYEESYLFPVRITDNKGQTIEQINKNFLITTIEQVYASIYEKIAFNLIYNIRTRNLDSLLYTMDSVCTAANDSFITSYCNYKKAKLEYLAMKRTPEKIAQKYFTTEQSLDNPAAIDLFHTLLANYFKDVANRKNGEILLTAINKDSSLAKVIQVIENNFPLVNESIRQLILLKSLYDAFYTNYFNRRSIIHLLHSYLTHPSSLYTSYAHEIKEKITQLHTGYPAPSFHLHDQEGRDFQLSLVLGKYVYLNFMHIDHHACIKDINILKDYREKFAGQLQIVSIITGENAHKVYQFIKRNNIGWTCLYAPMGHNVFSDYNIKAFPVYYLLDKEGRLLQSPAQSPDEQFESYFYEMLKSRKETIPQKEFNLFR